MSDTPGHFAIHRDAIERLCCPLEVKEALARYAQAVARVLGDQLVGIYIYGSLAHRCYHPATSDVDLVVVTESPCSEDAVSQILAASERSGIPIDATFITRSQLCTEETPTPVDFVLKPAGADRVIRLPQGQKDFLLQRQDVYDCNLALAGPCAGDIMRPVPREALAACLDYLFPNVLPRFKNAALMLCRIAHAFSNQALCSKRDAGQWARDAFDQRWRSMIDTALSRYANGTSDDQGANEELRAFEKYCAEYVSRLRRGDIHSTPTGRQER